MDSLLFSVSEAFAARINHYREEPDLRKEATRRNVRIIPIAQAQSIALKYVGSNNAFFENIQLYNEVSGKVKSFDFRPVFKMECYANGRSYEVLIDASTGAIINQ